MVALSAVGVPDGGTAHQNRCRSCTCRVVGGDVEVQRLVPRVEDDLIVLKVLGAGSGIREDVDDVGGVGDLPGRQVDVGRNGERPVRGGRPQDPVAGRARHRIPVDSELARPAAVMRTHHRHLAGKCSRRAAAQQPVAVATARRCDTDDRPADVVAALVTDREGPAEREPSTTGRDEPIAGVPDADGRGRDPDDGLRDPGVGLLERRVVRRSVEEGITEGEDPTVGRGEPIAVAVRCTARYRQRAH